MLLDDAGVAQCMERVVGDLGVQSPVELAVTRDTDRETLGVAAERANALECLIRNPALIPRMGLAARGFAAERFQAERLVDDMDRLYRELIERRLPVTAGYSALQRLTGEPG